MKGKMFGCVTCTFNPIVGCLHGCKYCWARQLALTKLKHTKKYGDGFYPKLWKPAFKRKFKPDDFVFVSDMGDLFGWWVPPERIEQVFKHIKKFPKTTFLLLTKNPERYRSIKITVNCVCGATVESDIDHKVSGARPPESRLLHMIMVKHKRKMISIEPIMRFNMRRFVNWLREIKPEFVYVGLDNYNNHLPEPSIEEIDNLIRELEQFTKVYVKESVEHRRMGLKITMSEGISGVGYTIEKEIEE